MWVSGPSASSSQRLQQNKIITGRKPESFYNAEEPHSLLDCFIVPGYYCSSVCGQQKIWGKWNCICSTCWLDLQMVGPAETSPLWWEDHSEESPDRWIKTVKEVYFWRCCITFSSMCKNTTMCSPSSLKWRTGQVDSLQRRQYLGDKKQETESLRYCRWQHNYLAGHVCKVRDNNSVRKFKK